MPEHRTLDSIRVDYAAPPHVPKDRVVDLSFAMGGVPNDLVDPYEPYEWLAGAEIPRLLYSMPSQQAMPAISGMRNGNWVVTHYEDIDRVYTDNEYFSNKGAAAFQRLIGESFRSIPLGVDPPEHSKYRMYLVPYFSPAHLARPRTAHPRCGCRDDRGGCSLGRSRHGLGFRPRLSGAHLHGADGIPSSNV
jgi:cytochrome P450